METTTTVVSDRSVAAAARPGPQARSDRSAVQPDRPLARLDQLALPWDQRVQPGQPVPLPDLSPQDRSPLPDQPVRPVFSCSCTNRRRPQRARARSVELQFCSFVLSRILLPLCPRDARTAMQPSGFAVGQQANRMLQLRQPRTKPSYPFATTSAHFCR